MTAAHTQHALILCHEIWGITPALRAKAATWRQRGLRVVVPSFYETVGLPAHALGEEAAFEARSALSRTSMTATLTAAIDHLQRSSDALPHISVLGYSMGGSIALWAATTNLPLTTSVTYYGGGLEVSPWPELSPGAVLLTGVRIPWLGLYGGRDPLTPPAALAKATDICGARGPEVEMHVYPDLEHAFALDERDTRFSASATRECEELVMQHLRGAERSHGHDTSANAEANAIR